MKKLINFIILSLLCYLAILIYRGKGVVDFNVVWGEVKTLLEVFGAWICQLFNKT